jgi:hypothetical protein
MTRNDLHEWIGAGFVTLKGEDVETVHVTQADLRSDGTVLLKAYKELDRIKDAAELARLSFDGNYRVHNDDQGKAESIVVYRHDPSIDDERAWLYRIDQERQP